MVHAHGESLIVITSAFLSISSSSCTNVAYYKGNVYGFWELGGKSPVSMSILIVVVLPISEKSKEKIVPEHKLISQHVDAGQLNIPH